MDEKTCYILNILLLKTLLKTDLYLGPLFEARSRRRIAPVCLVLLQNTSGFVLRPQQEVYYKNLASFGHRWCPSPNCTVFNSQPPFMCCAGTLYRNPSSYASSRFRNRSGCIFRVCTCIDRFPKLSHNQHPAGSHSQSRAGLFASSKNRRGAKKMKTKKVIAPRMFFELANNPARLLECDPAGC